MRSADRVPGLDGTVRVVLDDFCLAGPAWRDSRESDALSSPWLWLHRVALIKLHSPRSLDFRRTSNGGPKK
jgi:hypothetical protein